MMIIHCLSGHICSQIVGRGNELRQLGRATPTRWLMNGIALMSSYVLSAYLQKSESMSFPLFLSQTALILSAAGSFLAIPDINLTSKYCLIFTLLSSLASLAHATYHSHFYRSLIDDEHYTLLQLRCYLSCYRPIMGFLLCMPLLDLLYAIAAFSIAIIAYLWPYDPPSDVSNPPPLWEPPILAKVIIPTIYALQLGTIALSYKWNRSAFFTINELLVGEDGRRAQVMEDEEKRAEFLLSQIERDEAIADAVRVFDANAVGVAAITSLPGFN